MFTKLLAAAAMLAALASAATGAEITVQKNPKQPGHFWVFVIGDIVVGDHKKFLAATKAIPSGFGAVTLRSDGGALYEGLDIGVTIANRHFNTYADGTCASVCGMIWLAGNPIRWISERSNIGFHGAFNTETRQAVSGGNAVAGAYMAKLGFSYEVIHKLTQAGPDEMFWINAKLASQLGIRTMAK